MIAMRSIAVTAFSAFTAVLLACSSSSTSSPAEPPISPAEHTVSIFLTAELKGSTEPCGCTANPLGDLARTAQLIAQARSQGPVIVLDGGSTLYSQVKLSDVSRPQEQLKSALIASTFRDTIHIDAMGLGPYDLAEGVAMVRPPRQAANLNPTSGIAIDAPKILDVGGIKVGVFGLVSPTALTGFDIKVGEMTPVAQSTIRDLKQKGVDVIILLAQMTQDEARTLVKASPGMDFVLISQKLPEPNDIRAAPMQVGETWLFQPANRGQIISQLTLTKRTTGPFVDAIGAVRAKDEITRLDSEISLLKEDLAKWSGDPLADKAFVASKKLEHEKLLERRKALQSSPLQAPANSNYFTLAQLKISKELACLPEVVTAKQAYDKASGAANVVAGADIKPEAPTKGEASYVGMEECGMCHSKAMTFWETTNHAKAWKTLELVGKQFDFDCIGCHVTGFNKPGGSNIGFNEPLRTIQCEQCHGPGSLHIDAEGTAARVATIRRVPNESVCLECHTADHSDTFQFDAYLRDILGPGHGEERRAALGDGDTGHQLRNDALKKAGKSIGQHCPK